MIYTFTLNTAIDKIITFESEIKRRKNNKISNIMYDVGGKAVHVSIILEQLGIANKASGFIGSQNGGILIKLLEQYGVKSDFIEQEAKTRESVVLLDNSNEGSYMITEKGFRVSEDSYKRLLDYIEENLKLSDIAVFSGSPPPGIDVGKYTVILKKVKEKKAKIFVDSASDYLKAAIDSGVFMIKPNEDEFREIFNITEKIEEREYIKYLDMLLDKGTENIVLSLGKNGSILAKKNREIFRYYPPEIIQQNDTGAGDSFVGGIVSQVSLGESLEEAVLFGTAVSASKASQKLSSGFDIKQTQIFLSKIKREQWR